MNTTINISLPKKMLSDAKKTAKQENYVSISEFVRTAIREKIYETQGLTVNGFTPEFEEMVLKAEAEPEENGLVWETEEDVRNYFNNLRKSLGFSAKENAKSKKIRAISAGSKTSLQK